MSVERNFCLLKSLLYQLPNELFVFFPLSRSAGFSAFMRGVSVWWACHTSLVMASSSSGPALTSGEVKPLSRQHRDQPLKHPGQESAFVQTAKRHWT